MAVYSCCAAMRSTDPLGEVSQESQFCHGTIWSTRLSSSSEDRFLIVSGCVELTVDLATLNCSSGEFKTANGRVFMLVQR
jgi:hypothetical protein